MAGTDRKRRASRPRPARPFGQARSGRSPPRGAPLQQAPARTQALFGAGFVQGHTRLCPGRGQGACRGQARMPVPPGSRRDPSVKLPPHLLRVTGLAGQAVAAPTETVGVNSSPPLRTEQETGAACCLAPNWSLCLDVLVQNDWLHSGRVSPCRFTMGGCPERDSGRARGRRRAGRPVSGSGGWISTSRIDAMRL